MEAVCFANFTTMRLCLIVVNSPYKPNPNYKGKWYAAMIDNPDYKGEWAPRKIENPGYFEDLTPVKNLIKIVCCLFTYASYIYLPFTF